MLSEAEPVLASCFNLVSFGGATGCLATLLLGLGAALLTYILRFHLFLPRNLMRRGGFHISASSVGALTA